MNHPHSRFGGSHVNHMPNSHSAGVTRSNTNFQFSESLFNCPHFRFGCSHVTRSQLPVRQQSCDPPPLPVRQVSCEPPQGASDLPCHTSALPRPMQVVPFRVIKPQAKMAPAGIQDSTVSATSGSADSREPPHFRFRGSDVKWPHFRLGTGHVIFPTSGSAKVT